MFDWAHDWYFSRSLGVLLNIVLMLCTISTATAQLFFHSHPDCIILRGTEQCTGVGTSTFDFSTYIYIGMVGTFMAIMAAAMINSRHIAQLGVQTPCSGNNWKLCNGVFRFCTGGGVAAHVFELIMCLALCTGQAYVWIRDATACGLPHPPPPDTYGLPHPPPPDTYPITTLFGTPDTASLRVLGTCLGPVWRDPVVGDDNPHYVKAINANAAAIYMWAFWLPYVGFLLEDRSLVTSGSSIAAVLDAASHNCSVVAQMLQSVAVHGAGSCTAVNGSEAGSGVLQLPNASLPCARTDLFSPGGLDDRFATVDFFQCVCEQVADCARNNEPGLRVDSTRVLHVSIMASMVLVTIGAWWVALIRFGPAALSRSCELHGRARAAAGTLLELMSDLIIQSLCVALLIELIVAASLYPTMQSLLSNLTHKMIPELQRAAALANSTAVQALAADAAQTLGPPGSSEEVNHLETAEAALRAIVVFIVVAAVVQPIVFLYALIYNATEHRRNLRRVLSELNPPTTNEPPAASEGASNKDVSAPALPISARVSIRFRDDKPAGDVPPPRRCRMPWNYVWYDDQAEAAVEEAQEDAIDDEAKAAEEAASEFALRQLMDRVVLVTPPELVGAAPRFTGKAAASLVYGSLMIAVGAGAVVAFPMLFCTSSEVRHEAWKPLKPLVVSGIFALASPYGFKILGGAILQVQTGVAAWSSAQGISFRAPALFTLYYTITTIVGLGTGPIYALIRLIEGFLFLSYSLLDVTRAAYRSYWLPDPAYEAYVAALALVVFKEQHRRRTVPPPSVFEVVTPPPLARTQARHIFMVRAIAGSLVSFALPSLLNIIFLRVT